jgi:hypothetical protein
VKITRSSRSKAVLKQIETRQRVGHDREQGARHMTTQKPDNIHKDTKAGQGKGKTNIQDERKGQRPKKKT